MSRKLVGLGKKIGTKWLGIGLAVSLAFTIQLELGAILAPVHAEGPNDPAPFIAAKVVNENAGKKILFDNAHAQTAGAADWVIDGGFSDFGQALAADGFDVAELRKSTPISYSDLRGYSVFVIAEPNIPFKQSEQAAMEQYVQNGGSIFFIGDHYNADRNKNRWDGSEAINGYRRGAWEDPAKGMSSEERNSEAMQDVVSSDWLADHFGVRFRYNALGDITANHIVEPDQAFGITEGVDGIAMHAGSTLAITDPTKAKGIVYLPQTNESWGNAVDQGVYNGGGMEEGPYVAVAKVGLGKAAFIGDSSPVEDATPKYLREETGAKKTTYDGFKEQDDAVLLVNMINWLADQESYTSLAQVGDLQLDEVTELHSFEAPQASTEPQSEPWSTPAAGYKWWDRSTFKPGSYGGATVSASPVYSFVHQSVLPNAAEFQIRVLIENLPANSTVTGFSAGIYLTGGTQVAMTQRADGTWPTGYGYGDTFSLTADSQGRAYKDLTIRVKPGTSGGANLRLRQNGNNLLTQSVTLGNVPAEPLPDAGSSIPELITIAEGRSKPEGSLITVQGTVTTEPGIYGGQTFYLQDATGGVYVYQSSTGFHQGDVVKLTASTTLYNTELELASPVLIEKVGTEELPEAVKVDSVNAANQGQLIALQQVKITNIITASPSGSFEFDAISASGVSNHVRVDVRTGLSLGDFPYEEGQIVNLQGVSSIFKDVYQLKVRGISDISLAQANVPPETSAALSEQPNSNGWINRNVTLTLTATGSEPASTTYRLNDGAESEYSGPVVVDREGINIIQYYSSAGGVTEEVKTMEIKLDKTAPAVTLTQSGNRIGDVWEQDNLKFELHSTDEISGVITQKVLLDGQLIEEGQTISAKELGAGEHVIEYRVEDAAGNVASDRAVFQVKQPNAAAAPGIPVLSDNNGYSTGLRDGNYKVTMNLWWGNNGSEFKLYEDGVLIQSIPLKEASPSMQTASVDIKGKANGVYTYVGELVNAWGVSQSEPLRVTVTDASPGKPVLSHDNWDGDGSYLISANLWWGTNAAEYRLYENGVLIDTQALTNTSPGMQAAVTEIHDRAPGTYEYYAEWINAAGVTQSDRIQVRVGASGFKPQHAA
ncbi:chitinase N-terminal domain-containing protein [Paenibacillus glucanolyticus]